MEMNNFRGGESHVAQQSRRDKLRIQHQNYYDHNLEQLWGQTPDIEQLRNFKYGYDQTLFTSQMLNYVTKNDFFDNGTNGNYLLADNYSGNPNTLLVGGSSLYTTQPNCYGYQDVAQPSLGETSIFHQTSQKHFGEMQQQCNTICSPFNNYQNTLQQVVPNEELARDSNELLHFLPSFGDSTNSLSNTPVDQAFRHWNVEGLNNKNRDPQGLSLSLSSVPPSKTCQGHFRESSNLSDTRNSKTFKYSNYLCSNSGQSSAGSKGFGFPCDLQKIYDVAGPHGPFTGYATILKDSKYLKPALELFDDLCGSKHTKTCEIYLDTIDEEGDFSGVNTNTISGETGGRSSFNRSSWPGHHKKKANLLYLQQEVCSRYKQYQQQMQMVVSSFESVEGVSAATPYISMSLKTIAMHFRRLKEAISDQLKQTETTLGEDLSSPTAGTSSSTKRGNFQKQKSCAINKHIFLEPQQPVWKPQRGLPERAVSILRAWLFDHFLHPYPTDTDKHMLAIQSGLTRNQVSNWFINARVRIWKPMVEEIHLLETNGLGEKSSQMTLSKGSENMASECAVHQYDNQPASKLSGINSLTNSNGRSEEFWNQEKRSRVECQIPVSIDGSLMSFLPYQQQGGFEIGAGHGNVSLTLGLRQNAESVQHQMHQQEQHRQHFGGQMIHDFVG